MFHSLYARLMTLFMAVLCICMMLLSILLYVSIRDDKVEARLDELTKQARDIAYLASRRSVLPTNIDRYLEWKAEEVTRDFEADVLIVDRLRQIIPISGIKSGNEGERLSWEETLTYLLRVLNGEEIRVQTRPQNRPNDPVFTVGVPWVQNDVVVGAVFIHTSAQTIQASYQNVLWQVGGALALALGLMAVLTLLVTRRITHPLRQMSDAAEKIAHGDFDY
ncbi:MAG: HAMP domain-containing protein, partial [Clostridia bacterium]